MRATKIRTPLVDTGTRWYSSLRSQAKNTVSSLAASRLLVGTAA
jgi:hypothetical protein